MNCNVLPYTSTAKDKKIKVNDTEMCMKPQFRR